MGRGSTTKKMRQRDGQRRKKARRKRQIAAGKAAAANRPPKPTYPEAELDTHRNKTYCPLHKRWVWSRGVQHDEIFTCTWCGQKHRAVDPSRSQPAAEQEPEELKTAKINYTDTEHDTTCPHCHNYTNRKTQHNEVVTCSSCGQRHRAIDPRQRDKPPPQSAAPTPVPDPPAAEEKPAAAKINVHTQTVDCPHCGTTLTKVKNARKNKRCKACGGTFNAYKGTLAA